MLQDIHINHAFNGFLYAPVILADALGFFPGNMKLNYRTGDLEAIESLAKKDEGHRNWFAICDPFAKDISKVQASFGGKDEIYIVGSMINRLPIWLYNNSPDTEHVSSEDELMYYKPKIKAVECYLKYNTGYLIGERLLKKFGLAPDKLIQCKFSEEFIKTPNPDNLIVTSDILHITEEIDSNNIIFNYPQNAPDDLNPFLFTAILTLKSVIDQHLPSVLSVLSGIRKAMDLLGADHVDPECIEKLVNKYDPLLSQQVGDHIDRNKKTIKKAITTLFKEEEIYSLNFDVEETKKAYDNAKLHWEALVNRKFPEIDTCTNPIPSLLIRKNWAHDKNLIRIFANKYSENQIHS